MSTLSARNLFAGKDILNLLQRTEEIGDESELNNAESNGRERERMSLLELGKGESEAKQRSTYLDANKGKTEGIEGRILHAGKRIKKKIENAENIPVSLKLENVERKGGEDLLQIRINPPSQCFSAARPPSKITPSKPPLKSKLMEKEILQGQTNKQVITNDNSTENAKSICIAGDGREARTLDVFWFLKPCTLST